MIENLASFDRSRGKRGARGGDGTESPPTVAEVRRRLELATTALNIYGSAPFSRLLYRLARRSRPKVAVELGTGYGLSALWLGLALRENGDGHLWTVDDHDLPTTWMDCPIVLAQLAASGALEGAEPGELSALATDPGALVAALHRRFCLGSQVTLVRRTIDVRSSGLLADLTGADRPIDILFSDFRHDPETVAALLAHALPRMTRSGFLFIDSVATHAPSRRLVERAVEAFNLGRVPPELEPAQPALEAAVRSSRFKVRHIWRRSVGHQCCTTLLKLELGGSAGTQPVSRQGDFFR